MVTFGASGPVLAAAFREAGVRLREAGTLEEAVAAAFEAMAPGQALLFSPACASFDAFRNFADRARAFREALPARDGEARRPAD